MSLRSVHGSAKMNGNCVNYELMDMSSLNLRMGRRKDVREVGDVIPFSCDFCGRVRKLGRNSEVLVRIGYIVDGKEFEVRFCDRCIDVFTDIVRFGPRVLREAHKWRRASKMARVSMIRDRMLCLSCLGTEDTHLFVKFDDLFVSGDSASFLAKRICARCVISFILMMQQCEDVRVCKFSEYIPEARF